METLSGMSEASVAAKKEERITPPARRAGRELAGLDLGLQLAVHAFHGQALEAAVFAGSPAHGQLAQLLVGRGLGDTRRPARPSTFWRTASLLRMKAAACGSAMPRRCSSDSVVSLRVYSER
jgi:hypothetical protein